MALGRRGLRRGAEPRRTSRRQGEAFRLADLGYIAPGGQRQARGRRDRRRGRRKGFETWERKRRRREAWSRFQARHLLRRDRRLQLRGQIGVNGDVGEGLRNGMRRGRRSRPEGEDRFWKWGTLPVQSPDADRPSEGQSGPEGNNFWKDPLRTIPALERKVIECNF